MATFANQASNLSALGSKLDRLLKVPNPNDESQNYFRCKEEKQRSAEAFFESQKRRVDEIEKELSAATVSIFPCSKESKTITELAELCRLTQDITREKLEILKSRLEDEGYMVTSQKTTRIRADKISVSATHPPLDRKYSRKRIGATSLGIGPSRLESGTNYVSNDRFSWPFVANIGGALESVLEADYETDGLTTPGSCLQSPPLSLSFQASAMLESGEHYDSHALTTPTASTRKQKQLNLRKSSSFSIKSPTTPPTLDKLSISASTTHFLQHIEDEGETVNPMSPYNHLYRSQQQEGQHHLYEFRDEDDMITLDTQSTMTKNNNPYSPPGIVNNGSDQRPSVEQRSHFLTRMEGMLERMEESILEDSSSPKIYGRNNKDTMRHSDEHQLASLLFHHGKEDQLQSRHSNVSTSTSDNKAQSHHHTVKTFYKEDDSVSTDSDTESGTNESDESTNVVATQIAETSSAKEGMMSLVPGSEGSGNIEYLHNERPTHILVETGIASPAHTNITMDVTMMNDAFDVSFMRAQEKRSGNTDSEIQEPDNKLNFDEVDNLSTVTPVLDRYRLDPSDDNSIGVKVVPNKRSVHRIDQKRKTTPRQGKLPTIAQLSPSLDSILRAGTPKKEFHESAFKSPPITTSERHTRTMATTTPQNQVRKVYRKTPFAKNRTTVMEEDDSKYHAANENDNPNVSTSLFVPDSPEPFKSCTPSFSISVPPLRPRSFEPKRADESPLPLGTNTSLLQPGNSNDLKDRSHTSGYEPPTLSPFRTESSRYYLQGGTIEHVGPELTPPTGSSISNPGRLDPVAKTIKKESSESFFKDVTEAEFNSAPRIVRIHVDRDQANNALYAIQRFCSDSVAQLQSLEFTEKEGCTMLGFSEQKSKSILISLCHWRRLKMKKDANRGLIFAVNDGKK